MKVTKSFAVMALLGMVTAEQLRHRMRGVPSPHQRALAQHRLRAPDAVEAPPIKNPKADKKVVKALPNATIPMTQAEADEKINVGRKPIWGAEVPYSNQLANGDVDDNKELENEDDPRDLIVDDDGFVNQ